MYTHKSFSLDMPVEAVRHNNNDDHKDIAYDSSQNMKYGEEFGRKAMDVLR